MAAVSENLFPYETYQSLEQVRENITRIPDLVVEPDKDKVLRENWSDVQFANRITNRYSQVQRMKCKRTGFTDSPYDIYQKDQDNYDELISKAKGNTIQISRIRKDILKRSNECSLFPISRVLYLFKHLFGDDLSKIRWLDMSAGWGDRLIAAIALKIAKYQGVDPNSDMTSAYEQIITELAPDNLDSYNVKTTGFEDYDIGTEQYDIAFTSPPFFDYEIYSTDRAQSSSKYPTSREWTDNFMLPYVRKSMTALKDGGYLVLYIEQHGYDYVDRLIEELGEPDILYMGYNDRQTRRPFYIWQKGVTREDMEDEERVIAPTPSPAIAQGGDTGGDVAEAGAAPSKSVMPLPILPPTSGSGSGRPYAVIVLRGFGDLPSTGAFSLMTSGFLTDGVTIPGNTISHVQEEKIRHILGLDTEEAPDGNKVRINAYDTIQHTDHRLAIEDLVRVLPLSAHVLLELSTLTTECIERIVRILIASNRRVVIYRVVREAMPDHFPRTRDDLSRIRSSKHKSASVAPNVNGQERFVHLTEEEYQLVQSEITNTIGHLRDLGGNPQDLVYNPDDMLVRINDRVCELLTRDHIRTRGGARILYDPRDTLSEYIGEYKNGGSMREYNMTVPIRTGFVQEITPQEWETGKSDTLIVEPMRIKSGGRSMNITSHTEVIIRDPKIDDQPPFVSLSWHRGDLRTIQIHHEPMNTNMKVL